jgi:4-hydroxy-tetrahydrodipicolinate synthase
LYQHFKAVAEAVAIPQILYNVPPRTGCDMKNETVERLADIGNIVGIKDATGDVERGADLAKRLGDRVAVYGGDDATGLALMLSGAKGVISVSANVAPKLMAQMCEAALRGDKATANALDQRLRPLHEQLYGEANPIPVKWALHEMGKISAGIRLPLTPLSESFRPVVREALRAVGIL